MTTSKTSKPAFKPLLDYVFADGSGNALMYRDGDFGMRDEIVAISSASGAPSMPVVTYAVMKAVSEYNVAKVRIYNATGDGLRCDRHLVAEFAGRDLVGAGYDGSIPVLSATRRIIEDAIREYEGSAA